MNQITGDPTGTVTAYFIYAVRYGYSDTVIHSDNQLRIFPREGEGQSGAETNVWSVPSGRGVEFKDRFGNRVQRLRVIEPHGTFVVASAGRVNLSVETPPEEDAHIRQLQGLPEILEYGSLSPLVDPDSVAKAARDLAGGSDSLLTVVKGIVNWVYENITYRRGTTSVGTTAEQVLVAGAGVCQDKTHLALGMLRALNVPTRYVSGLIAGQSGETHSWIEFLHPQQGWLAADPTRGVVLRPASDYVKFGVGRDYTDVSPVTGSFISEGAAAEVAAIADVQFTERWATPEDAMGMLKDAIVVRNEAAVPLETPIGPESDE